MQRFYFKIYNIKFILYLFSGIFPSVKLPKIKFKKKNFMFGRRNSITASKSGDTTATTYITPTTRESEITSAVIPTISSKVKDNYVENSQSFYDNPEQYEYEYNCLPPMHYQHRQQQQHEFETNKQQRYQIHCDLQHCNKAIDSNNARDIVPTTEPSKNGIILNIPLKSNNVRRAPEMRDMNHEKFTPCYHKTNFKEHEHSISNCNENGNQNFTLLQAQVSSIKIITTPTISDETTHNSNQDAYYNVDEECINGPTPQPPPRRKSKVNALNQNDKCTENPIPNISYDEPNDKQFSFGENLDFVSMYSTQSDLTFLDNAIGNCCQQQQNKITTTLDEINSNKYIDNLPPRNKSDPWTVNLDCGKLENDYIPKPVPITNSSNSSSSSSLQVNDDSPTLNKFEDQFVDIHQYNSWHNGTKQIETKRKLYQKQYSIDIFNQNNAKKDVFDDFDEIFSDSTKHSLKSIQSYEKEEISCENNDTFPASDTSIADRTTDVEQNKKNSIKSSGRYFGITEIQKLKKNIVEKVDSLVGCTIGGTTEKDVERNHANSFPEFSLQKENQFVAEINNMNDTEADVEKSTNELQWAKKDIRNYIVQQLACEVKCNKVRQDCSLERFHEAAHLDQINGKSSFFSSLK